MRFSSREEGSFRRLPRAVFLLALLPLLVLFGRGFSGGLGANPIETIERTLGYWTLTLLTITLAVTPDFQDHRMCDAPAWAISAIMPLVFLA